MKPYINAVILLILVLFFGVLKARGIAGADSFLLSAFCVLLALLDPRGGEPRFPNDQPKP